MKYPNRIKELRKESGLSQKKVAAIAGTTHQQIARLEKGERRLTIDWMRRISPAFGCDPPDLIDSANVLAAQERELIGVLRILPAKHQAVVYRLAANLAESLETSDSIEVEDIVNGGVAYQGEERRLLNAQANYDGEERREPERYVVRKV